jgi:protein-disulfide isomerase
MRMFRNALEVAVLVTALGASALIMKELWARSEERPTDRSSMAVPDKLISLDGAARKGNSSVSAVMIIYSDFECPFCAKFARTSLAEIEKDYVQNGLLGLAFRNMPLERIHPYASSAAETGVCAGRQGRFWEWHDAMFKSKTPFESETISLVSSATGLNVAALKRCIQSGEGADQVKRETEEAKALGIRGTPTFLLGQVQATGQVKPHSMFSGWRSIQYFKSALDDLVSRTIR